MSINALPVDSNADDFYIFTHFGLIKTLISNFKCLECYEGSIEVTNLPINRKGFCYHLVINCNICEWKTDFYSSSEISKRFNRRKSRMNDANVRAVIAFREIGCGHSAMSNFSTVMNTGSLSKLGFKTINNQVMSAYRLAADDSMKKAAKQVKQIDVVDGLSCARVSFDGIWQKRGHASLHGVVTAMSGDKIIDLVVKSKRCYGCRMWEGKKGTKEYDNWLANHCCSINHEISSGAMESSGAVSIFERSIKKNCLIYKEYLGDGDSSSFADVVKSEPYKDHKVTPEKLEVSVMSRRG